MGRPPLALGTPGAIRYYRTATGYRARVLVRDYDGHVRALERRAPTKTAAERALTSTLRDRAPSAPAARSRRPRPAALSRSGADGEQWMGVLHGPTAQPGRSRGSGTS